MSAPTPAPTTSPRRCAGRSAPTPSTQAVTVALLAAVEPGQLALALAAAGEVTARRQRSVRAAELAVERARYDADRAERAFLACEPENRLVARSLEAAGRPGSPTSPKPRPRSPPSCRPSPSCPAPEQLAATVADLPALWSAPTTSDKDRKRLLRTLLGDVTLTPVGQRPRAAGGRAALEIRGQPAGPGHPAQERHPAAQPPTRPPSNSPAASAPAWTTTPWPPRSNDAGHRTGTGQPFDGVAAGNLRELPPHPLPRPARRRRAHPPSDRRADRGVHRHHPLLDQLRLPARPPRRGRRWAIPFPAEVEAACRDRATGSAHQHRDTDPAPQADDEYSIADVARRLGVKPDVIYAWAQWGHVPARRGPAGRLWIHLTPAIEQACLQRIASSYKLPAAVKAQAAQRLERKAV